MSRQLLRLMILLFSVFVAMGTLSFIMLTGDFSFPIRIATLIAGLGIAWSAIDILHNP